MTSQHDRRSFRGNDRAAQPLLALRRALQATTAALCMAPAAALTLGVSPAGAQSVTWNGANSDYSQDANWDPQTAPTTPGLSASFEGTGSATIIVPEAITLDGWLFTGDAQNYDVSGARVALDGDLTNQAGAGATIAVSNNVNASGSLVQSGEGRLVLTGSSSFDAGAFISSGTLSLEAGGLVFSSETGIGVESGSNGAVTVSGLGSQWFGGDLLVADEGSGTLLVEDGAAMASRNGVLGVSAGSQGGATVTGEGSQWIANGGLFVGNGGAGTLLVDGGGLVLSAQGAIGIGEDATGKVTVTGTGSAWQTRDALVVGVQGAGTLVVEAGGAVASDQGSLGNEASGTGTATVTGAGSSWAAGGQLLVGFLGRGELIVEEGATVSNGGGVVGLARGSSGTASVTGTASSWNNGGDLVVGSGGSGTLTVSDGGLVRNANGQLGQVEGTSGTAVVSGAGSRWANNERLTVGIEGRGELTVVAGGVVSNTDGYLGFYEGGSGAASVTGAASSWNNSGDLFVGREGSGTLTVSEGGIVSSGQGSVGDRSGATGSVTVTGTGSSWRNRDNVFIGDGGKGELAISNGGTVTGNAGIVGGEAGGSGAVTVTGAGSSWAGRAELVVGSEGQGELAVSAGGTVTAAAGGIGEVAGGSGKATVTGEGSRWANGGGLFVGVAGNGQLTVSAGGTVSSAQGIVGDSSGATGAVTVTGAGSSWLNSEDLFVGSEGTGELTVSAGGTVASRQSIIGDLSGAMGKATITGTGSSWTTSDTLFVGSEGSGELTVSNGGAVSVGADGQGTLVIGDAESGEGTVAIGGASGSAPEAAGRIAAAQIEFGDGGSVLEFNHADNMDGSALRVSSVLVGEGEIFQLAGTTVLTGSNSADASFEGSVDVSGGQLVVNGLLGDLDPDGGRNEARVSVGEGGTLAGTGTIAGDLAVTDGGTLSPGNSPGTLSVLGNVSVASGSTFLVETVTATGASDRLAVEGSATLAGGTVRQTGSGASRFGQTFRILSADGGVSGRFAGITTTAAPALFLQPTLVYGTDYVDVLIDRNATAFASAADTSNGRAVAESLDALLATGNGAAAAVANLSSAAEAQGAFDALSGEIHASVQTGLLEDSRHVREAVAARAEASFGASPAENGRGESAAQSGRPDAWIAGYGSFGTTDGDGNAAQLDRDTGGVLVGADFGVGADSRLGFLLGYGHGRFDADERASTARVDTVHLGAYGMTELGGMEISGGGAVAFNDVDTSRGVSFAGFTDTTSGGYDSRTAQAFGEAGYRFAAGGLSFKPFAGLAYVNVDADGFEEEGGDASLEADGQSADAAFSTLGVRGSADVKLGRADLTLQGAVGWRHLFGDDTPDATLAFASSGGVPFTVEGAPLSRNAAFVEAGVETRLAPNAALGVSYAGQFGEDSTDNAVKASFRLDF